MATENHCFHQLLITWPARVVSRRRIARWSTLLIGSTFLPAMYS
ncbi:hypothetical protein ACXYMU_11135 [Pontibacter sp. CAU 1760]